MFIVAMNFFNNARIMCACRVLLLYSSVIQNVKCDEQSLTDVINSLPTDAFIKVFYEGLRPYDIFEIRTPITLWHHQQDWYLEYNITFICKFFPIGRNIGSRTTKIINIVQINIPFYERRRSWNYSYILSTVSGNPKVWDKMGIEIKDHKCSFDGSNTQTVILGDRALSEMLANSLTLYSDYLAWQIYRRNVALLFRLKSQTSFSKVCRVFTT
jgi:hypothetical protein